MPQPDNSISPKAVRSKLGWRRIVFFVVVLAYAGFLVFINALMFLPVLGLLPDNVLSAMGHFGDFLSTGDTHNLIHELVFAFVIGTAAVGLLSQLWKPKESASWRIAGQLVALIAWITMIAVAALTNNWVPQPLFLIFGGLTLLSTVFHPAGRGLFSWFSTAQIHRILLALIAVAAIPLLVYAFANISLQRGAIVNAQGFLNHGPSLHVGDTTKPSQEQLSTEVDVMAASGEENHEEEHANQGHYRNMAALSLIIILVGVLASLYPPGWRLAAWIAGGLPMLLGLASAVLPTAESSFGMAWGVAAVVWGVVFIATAEFTKHSSPQSG